MKITGEVLLGTGAKTTGRTYAAIAATTGEAMEPPFFAAGGEEVDQACALADEAYDTFRETDPEVRARLLDAAADEIDALGDALIVRAALESGLPRARLEGERARTTGQLRMFARVVRCGEWIDARIDPAIADRKPLPRPDLRLRRIGVGPVAVFGASNFPLAFSTAGGDTASALAAGCPVIVKGHPAHPGTGELVGRALQAAIAREGLPSGVFALLGGPDVALGSALVADPRVKAVGFTGSRAGGLALCAVAARRPEPIPVFAEMSSVNPVYLLPGALEERAEVLGESYVVSLTMGAGQFCTNPGIVIGLRGAGLTRFMNSAASALEMADGAVMLSPTIVGAFEEGVAHLLASDKVKLLARGRPAGGPHPVSAALFTVEATDFLTDAHLRREVFGASSIIVQCASEAEMRSVTATLEGQLTATIHFAESDKGLAHALVPALERKVGRIVGNGWPTGVEVSHAMVHGGPFPATSDARTTSVGAAAIERFLRPVCYQSLPQDLLPPALLDANPFGLRRRIDGILEA